MTHSKNQTKYYRTALLALVAVLISFPLEAQVNLMTNEKAWSKFKSERNYEVLSKFDTVCHSPLLIYGIYGKNGYVGIIDHRGREVTQAKYHMIEGLNLDHTSNMFMLYDHYSVRKGKKYGVLKNTGELIFPLDSGYISVERYGVDSLAQVKRVELMEQATQYKKTELFPNGKKGKETIYTDADYETQTLVMSDEFGELEGEGIEILALKDGSDWEGPIDVSKAPQRTYKSPPQFHPTLGKRINIFSKDHYVYEDTATGKLGIANVKTLKMVLPHEYSQFRRFFNGKDDHMFEKKGKQGIMNSNFIIKLKPEWDEIRPFQSNYTIRKGKYYAVFDSTFKRISEFNYIYNQPANRKMGYVVKALTANGQEVLLNYQGKEILKFDFKGLKIPQCGKMGKPVIILELEGGFKLLDINGEALLEDLFESIVAECNVSSEDGHVRPKWNMIQNSANTGFYVKKNNQYGYINSEMELRVPPSYLAMGESYYKDFLYVRSSKGWGVLNSNTGEIIIPLESRICPKGNSGLIRTLSSEGYIYWNKKGEKLTSPIPKGEYFSKVYHGLYRIDNGKKGAIFFDDEGSRMDTEDIR